MKPEQTDHCYKASQATAIAGVTKRMLHQWVTLGLIPDLRKTSVGTGADRLYSQRNLLTIIALRLLRSVGFPLSELADVALFVGTTELKKREERVVRVQPGGSFSVVTSSVSVTLSRGVQVLLDLRYIQKELSAGISRWGNQGTPRRGRKKAAQ